MNTLKIYTVALLLLISCFACTDYNTLPNPTTLHIEVDKNIPMLYGTGLYTEGPVNSNYSNDLFVTELSLYLDSISNLTVIDQPNSNSYTLKIHHLDGVEHFKTTQTVSTCLSVLITKDFELTKGSFEVHASLLDPYGSLVEDFELKQFGGEYVVKREKTKNDDGTKSCEDPYKSGSQPKINEIGKLLAKTLKQRVVEKLYKEVK